MKAITVLPGKADSTALADIPEPKITDLPDGRGVRVKILRVGLDGTDKEIKVGEYGAVPDGADFLVLRAAQAGHLRLAAPRWHITNSNQARRG